MGSISCTMLRTGCVSALKVDSTTLGLAGLRAALDASKSSLSFAKSPL